MTIYDLLAAYQDEVHKTAVYREIMHGTLRSPRCHDISKLKTFDSFLTSTDYSRFTTIKSAKSTTFLTVIKEVTKKPYVYYDIQLSDAHPTLNSLLAADNCFLCQMTSGELRLIEFSGAHDREDILAVLAFPINFTYSLCLRWESSHEWIESCGAFKNCTNLRYVAPIPEGYTDAAAAFEGCSSLNSPIFLPQSMTWCPGIVKDCTSFNSNIFVHSQSAEGLGIQELADKLKQY